MIPGAGHRSLSGRVTSTRPRCHPDEASTRGRPRHEAPIGDQHRRAVGPRRLDPDPFLAGLAHPRIRERAAIGRPQAHALRVLLEELQVLAHDQQARDEARRDERRGPVPHAPAEPELLLVGFRIQVQQPLAVGAPEVRRDQGVADLDDLARADVDAPRAGARDAPRSPGTRSDRPSGLTTKVSSPSNGTSGSPRLGLDVVDDQPLASRAGQRVEERSTVVGPHRAR